MSGKDKAPAGIATDDDTSTSVPIRLLNPEAPATSKDVW